MKANGLQKVRIGDAGCQADERYGAGGEEPGEQPGTPVALRLLRHRKPVENGPPRLERAMAQLQPEMAAFTTNEMHEMLHLHSALGSKS